MREREKKEGMGVDDAWMGWTWTPENPLLGFFVGLFLSFFWGYIWASVCSFPYVDHDVGKGRSVVFCFCFFRFRFRFLLRIGLLVFDSSWIC